MSASGSSSCNNKNFIQSNLNIIYTNADSFVNKREELIVFLQSLTVKPAAIIITEVNPKASCEGLQESEFSLTGYKIYSVNVGTSGKRGIIVYIDALLNSCEINVTSDFSEYIILKIYLEKENTLHLGAFYRSPASNINNDENLLSLLDAICRNSRQNIILIGDFNHKHIDWVNYVADTNSSISEKKFVTNLQDNLLTQTVTFSTRARLMFLQPLTL